MIHSITPLMLGMCTLNTHYLSWDQVSNYIGAQIDEVKVLEFKLFPDPSLVQAISPLV